MQGLGYNAYLKGVHEKLTADESKALKGQSSSKSKTTYDFIQLTSSKLKSNTLRPSERVQLLSQIELLYTEEETKRSTSEKSKTSLKVLITHADFVASLKETKPSISVQEKRKLDNVYRQFLNDRDGNMPDGTASSEIGGRTSLM